VKKQDEMDSISVCYSGHGQNFSMTRSEGAEILLANGATEFEIDELWQAAPGSAFFVDDVNEQTKFIGRIVAEGGSK